MTERDNFVLAEQVRVMYSNTLIAAVTHPCAAAAFAWILRDTVQPSVLLTWLACLVAMSVLRTSIYLAYQRAPADAAPRRWGNIHLLVIFSYGLIWSAAWLFFIPDPEPYHFAIIATFVTGVTGAGAIGYSVSMQALLVYVLPMIVPTTLYFYTFASDAAIGLAVALTVYLTILIRVMLPVNRSMIDSIRLNAGLEAEIEGRKIIEAQLRQMTLKDGLTGLSNRRHFDESLENEIRRARRSGKPCSLILIDIDEFKAFNDTYGHVEGDACLQALCRVVGKATRRPGDVAARYGGEELAVILPDTESESAYAIAENIRAEIEALAIPHEASTVPDSKVVTVSVGVTTTVPGVTVAPASLINLADESLYRAKNAGRNRVMSAPSEAAA